LGTETPVMCDWDSHAQLGDCLMNYKYGKQYHVLNAYMLTSKYGDSLRLMSSYAFFTFRQGPPGVGVDTLHDEVVRVYTHGNDGKWVASRCRSKPTTSPVTSGWDIDQDRPWICEHRWKGMSGMVRFRKLIMQDPKKNQMMYKWSDDQGRIAYSMGKVGFVMLSRGWNWYSQCGVNDTKDLAADKHLVTSLPKGVYCNLANVHEALPAHVNWRPELCDSDTVTVSESGKITKASLSPGEVIVIHVNYPAQGERPAEKIEEDIESPQSAGPEFWGWRVLQEGYGMQTGCCFWLDVTAYNEVVSMKTKKGMTQVNCEESHDRSEGNSPMLIGWNRKCPSSPEEGLEWIDWGQQSERGSDGAVPVKIHKYWADTTVVFCLLIFGEVMIVLIVMQKCKFAPSRNRGAPAQVEMVDILLENQS